MSMDLTGILNQNEYYTNHYFLSIFEENAKEAIDRWQNAATQSGDKTPWAKLNAYASKYMRFVIEHHVSVVICSLSRSSASLQKKS